MKRVGSKRIHASIARRIVSRIRDCYLFSQFRDRQLHIAFGMGSSRLEDLR